MGEYDAKLQDVAISSPDRSTALRLLWFVILWMAGVLALALVAYPIRWALKA